MKEAPFVSVVMPVRNEAGFVARALRAVLTQSWPEEKLEVIVADGMSTDGTREIVESFAEVHPRVTRIDNPGRIAPTGLNAAIARARGDVVVRVDGHCEIAPDYVARCVQHLVVDEVDCVGGPLTTVGTTRVARAIALAMSSRFGVGGARFRVGTDRPVLADTVAFPAFRRAALTRTGAFDEELVRNQDDEYSFRLRKRGGKILLAPDVRAVYYSRASWPRLAGQYFQYGFYKVRVAQKHPRQMSARQLAPPAFVAALGASLLVAPTALGRLPLAGLAALWALAAGASVVALARRAGPLDALLLPPTFAILHLSYGTGFLCGLVRFARGFVRTHPDAPSREPAPPVREASA
ncbi:MAG TPA: glycosyltransferase family 2 protein [Thermoanaerobaculia bacterium]|nr:glycosyltransferase family 2 protein [Thermoanaerobaculia bacterium]